jgi:predicted Zn-dependent protease
MKSLKLSKRIAIISLGTAVCIGSSIALISGCKSDGTDNSGAFGGLTGLLPGKTGQYVESGVEATSALTLGEADEDGMGQSVAVNVTSTYGYYDNQQVNDYVTLVGLTVASATPWGDRRIVFGVLDSDQVGAFSGPNGYVMVTRGAITRMQDEAELAGVLAHEISHVCNHDGLNSVKESKFASSLVHLASTNNKVAMFNQLADASVDVVVKTGYSQPQEFAADDGAVKYMTAAGYDPASYARFLSRLSQEMGSSGGQVMSTHPGLADRVGKVTAAANATGRAGVGATNADRFLAIKAIMVK